MLSPAIALKKKLAGNDPVVGAMATDHVWPLLVELCRDGGLDYLVIDCEHGCHGDEQVAHACQVGRLIDFPVLVRVISREMSVIRRAMDLGPCGLIVPCVESAGELDDVRNAALMPPRGIRRPGGLGNYWMKDFHYTTWRDELEEHFIVIPQIETRAGVDNVAGIAAHPLTTALGVGPYDLSADLGCCWDPLAPAHRAAMKQIKQAADAAGKKVWMGGDGPTLAAEGYTFIWIGTASVVLKKGFARAIDEIRNPGAVRPSGESAPPSA